MTTAALAVTLSVMPFPGESQAHAQVSAAGDRQTPEYHTTLVSLRDTVAALNGRLSHLRRQLPGAASVTLLRWTAEANRRCRETLASLEAAAPIFRQAGRDRLSVAARVFADTLDQTSSVVRKHCVDGIVHEGPGEWADSVRAWVPYHVGMLERQFASYNREAARFASVAGFKLAPRLPAQGVQRIPR